MKCVNCKQTIPETSVICPYCKNDPLVEVINVTDFGDIDETLYASDDRFDIKTYIKEPKNKKMVILAILVTLFVILLFTFLILSMFRKKTDTSYKTYTKVVDYISEYLNENYFSNSSIRSGEYSLELNLSDYKTKFTGSYSVDFVSRILSLNGSMRDPKEDEGEIVLESKEFTYDLYTNLNNIYFKSKEFYNDEYILFPIEDNIGLLKTKQYSIDSLITSISDATITSLKKLNYVVENEKIMYRDTETNTKKISLILNNSNLRIFFDTLINELMEDSNFINEISRVTDMTSSQVLDTLNNYKTTFSYKYNEENETNNKISIHYSGKKIIRISFYYNEDKFNFDIGDTKYYFYYYKNDEEIIHINFTKVEKQIDDIINKTYEINYRTSDSFGIITLKLAENEKSKLDKREIESYKSVKDFNEEDLNIIKNNMSYYNKSFPDLIENIFSSFDYRCNPNLECVCDDTTNECSCAYNGTMITCKIEDIKK